jgi:pantoate--beta-alanine ligase
MSLEVITNSKEMMDWSNRQLGLGHSIGLVPTMGAFHVGHLRLVEKAASTSDKLVVSIFVNPTQFGPNEDLAAYPRTLNEDIKLLNEQGETDVVFAPNVQEMYPLGTNRTWVVVDKLGEYLCGASRPGHFRGVTTIVSRLFTIAQPTKAFFGLKDAQQYFILKRMAQEMCFQTEIIGIETVRESDGLALSSRNRYLSYEERAQAVALSKAVRIAKHLIEEGKEIHSHVILSAMLGVLESATLGKIDYVEVVEGEDLQPIDILVPGMVVLAAVAYKFGKARLIDNSISHVPPR